MVYRGIWQQDELGNWWYKTKQQRHRGIVKPCAYCEKEFVVVLSKKRQRFCSNQCSQRARSPWWDIELDMTTAIRKEQSGSIRWVKDVLGNWWELSKGKKHSRAEVAICENCGKEFPRRPRLGIRFCTRKCAAPTHSKVMRAKRNGQPGGRSRNSGGYMLVYYPEHPYAQANGWVLEHRLVMEQLLGRNLLPNEEVHHKNGIKDDNRPENLELWARSQPAGVRSDGKHCPTCTCIEGLLHIT